MARVRIEWVPIQAYSLGLFGLDHLQLVYQPSHLTPEQQDFWYVMEGTFGNDPALGHWTLGVAGTDGITTLRAANPVNENGDYRYPEPEELIDLIGTPFSRGSRGLPLLDPFNAWHSMASYGSEIENQDLPYVGLGFSTTGLPTINSTSVIASMLHSVGLDIGNYFPYGIRLSPGRTTFIGTTQDDTLEIQGSFKSLVGGKGNDTFIGTAASTTESFYGGLGNDIFKSSAGFNIYHGGQPYMDYATDGMDTVVYDGIGEVFINKNPAAIPHIFPKYIATYATGSDWLFSIDRLQWDNTTDHISLGQGLQILEDGLIIDLNGQNPAAPANSKGDTLDLSQTSDGLLINAATADAVFITDVSASPGAKGLWLEDAEWIIGSSGNDKIYLAASMRGAEGGDGDDIIDARLASGSAGAGPNGYGVEIDGSDGDDILIGASGTTYAQGGSGDDRFVLSAMSDTAVEPGVVEFIIADADAGDRLYTAYNFFNKTGEGFEGSQLMPLLGAIGSFADMRDEGWPSYFQMLTENDRFYGDDRTSGAIEFAGAIEYSLEGDDLLIKLYKGEAVDVTEEIDDSGTTETYTENFWLLETETIIRVLDFSEGDLGLVFHDLGEGTSIDLGNGRIGTSYPGWDAAISALTNSSDFLAPLPERPAPPASNPNETDPSSGPEFLVGSTGDDIIAATAASNNIDAGAGNDTVTGGVGDDTLDGGPGSDLLQGGPGDDTYIVDNVGDTVIELEFAGTDTVFSSVSFVLPAHVENLTLTGAALIATGNASANTLIGNAEDNVLEGGAGNDTLYGGAGNDVLIGGDGDDVYVYQTGDGDDVIIDTGTQSANDELVILGSSGAGDLSLLRRSDTPDDLIIQLAAGGRILVEDFFTASAAGIDTISFEQGPSLSRSEIEQLANAGTPIANDPPQALDDIDLIAIGSTIIVPSAALLANDRDFDGDTLTITSIADVINASAVLQSNGDIELSLTPGFSGEVSFTYTISDTAGASDTATVAIAVLPETSAPEAADDLGFEVADLGTLQIAAAELLANDFDFDGDELTVTSVSNALNGTVALDAGGGITFDPSEGYSGPASFDYTITDATGQTDTASVGITVHQVNTINGTSASETIAGTNGWDRIYGLEGNDIISGGNGSDEIFGGAGSDTIDGGAGADYLDGGDGNDTIYGGGNSDIILGGNNADTLYGDAGNDTIDGGSGNDLIYGGTGTDTLFGGSGADTIDGGEGSDWIYGGDGNDLIEGGEGKDHLFGEAGDDVINGGTGNDEIFGGGGYDTLSGGDDDDTLSGDAGNDILNGDAGDDVLLGGTGTDTLDGGLGDDVLDGGEGSDTMTGGLGSDTFVFRPGYGKDVITDFTTASSGLPGADLVDMADFGYADFQALMQDTAQNGSDAIITIDASTTLTLQNIQVSALSDADFRLV